MRKMTLALVLLFGLSAHAQYDECYSGCKYGGSEIYQWGGQWYQCKYAQCVPAAPMQQGLPNCTPHDQCSPYPGPPPPDPYCVRSGTYHCRPDADPFCNECITEGFTAAQCCIYGCLNYCSGNSVVDEAECAAVDSSSES